VKSNHVAGVDLHHLGHLVDHVVCVDNALRCERRFVLSTSPVLQTGSVEAWILGCSRSSISRLDVREHGCTTAVEEHLLELRHVLSFVEAPENVKIGEMPALELDLPHGDRHTPDLLKKLWDPADARQLADHTGVGVFRRVLQAIHIRLLWWG
jgi:hypothetical protein